jgi:hypothetical protein
MPAINWSFICDYAFVDEKGRASIIRTFSFIHAHHLPIRYPQLFLVLEILSARAETFTLGALINSPSGETIARVEIKHAGSDQGGSATEKIVLPIAFYNLQFSETGEHHIEIFINESSIHFMPLMIQVGGGSSQSAP